LATWRQKALTLFPDLRLDLEATDSSPYTAFFELLPRAIAAHRASNTEELRRLYGYALWCMRQKTKEPRNAAAVCFFEHLFDAGELREDVVPWLPPDVISDCWSLWRIHLDQEQLADLQRLFRARKLTLYQTAVEP
jgi:hypothetical protein